MIVLTVRHTQSVIDFLFCSGCYPWGRVHCDAKGTAESCQRPRRGGVAHQTAQRGLCPGQHSHPPLLRQRDLFSCAPAGLQPGELVQAALPAAGLSQRDATKPAPQDPAHARPSAPHPQMPPLGHAHERAAGGGLELCLAPNQETQAITSSLFTQDSG